MNKSATLQKASQTHQEAAKPQISRSAMADVVELVKTLEAPYLKDLQMLVEGEIKERAARDRTDAIAKFRLLAADIMAKTGCNAEELFGMVYGKSRSSRLRRPNGPATIKYRHPDQPELHWTGQGRQPKWIGKFLEQNSGKTLDSLKIEKPQ